jgi:hypothetical protein
MLPLRYLNVQLSGLDEEVSVLCEPTTDQVCGPVIREKLVGPAHKSIVFIEPEGTWRFAQTATLTLPGSWRAGRSSRSTSRTISPTCTRCKFPIRVSGKT